jgi:hypothetical protein
MVKSPNVVNKHQNTFIWEMLFQQGKPLGGAEQVPGASDQAQSRASSTSPQPLIKASTRPRYN